MKEMLMIGITATKVMIFGEVLVDVVITPE